MAVDRFDLVILGNEPAGLWLASQLAQSAQNLGVPLRIGWIELTPCPPSDEISIPRAVGQYAGISERPSWSLDILYPRHRVPWNTQEIYRRYPTLPALPEPTQAADWLLKLPRPALSAIRYTLEKNPDLVNLAFGAWQFIGRCFELFPESLVPASLLAADLVNWSAKAELPASVVRETIDVFHNPVESWEHARSSGLTVEFRNRTRWIGDSWIINSTSLSLSALFRLQSRLSEVCRTDAGSSPRAFYDLELTTRGSAVPRCASRAFVMMDSATLPDTFDEFLPVLWDGKNSAYRMKVASWREPSLEDFCQNAKKKLRLFSGFFPYVQSSLESVFPPLDFGSCSADESRPIALDALWRSRVELYSHAELRSDTRFESVHVLHPSMGCNLPYPLGPLRVAKRLQVLLAKQFQKKYKKVSAPPPRSQAHV